ncbi:MAG TPA: rhodanese-like domain-containing protein [Acidocella sp.]|jgi:UPF0176 protein|nr:rhodanese-like domain-containing protein [Acidocella sp.]
MSEDLPNKVAAFYQFIRLDDPGAVREEFLGLCGGNIWGTVLVSLEGINGTLAGAPQAIDSFVAALARPAAHRPAFDRLELKFSAAGPKHFDRLKIKLKREIITFGRTLAPDAPVGRAVGTCEWNRLIDDPDVLVLDTRNGFEVEMGTFARATDPKLTSFSAFKTYVDRELAHDKSRKIAMFCTGGIRCEKASAYMIEAGFSEVYQLQGGILRYLEEMPEAESRWRGGCFVFDQRIALGHGLKVETPKLHPNFLDTTPEKDAE